MTETGGLAIETRLLCDCRAVISIYRRGDGSLYLPGSVVTDEDREPFPVTCHACHRTGTVDPVALRHAIAEQARTFRIK